MLPGPGLRQVGWASWPPLWLFYHTLLVFVGVQHPREAGPQVTKRKAQGSYRYRVDAGLWTSRIFKRQMTDGSCSCMWGCLVRAPFLSLSCLTLGPPWLYLIPLPLLPSFSWEGVDERRSRANLLRPGGWRKGRAVSRQWVCCVWGPGEWVCLRRWLCLWRGWEFGAGKGRAWVWLERGQWLQSARLSHGPRPGRWSPELLAWLGVGCLRCPPCPRAPRLCEVL